MRFRPGVLIGQEVEAVYADAKDRMYALPAVNVISTSTVNAVLETAREVQSPVIIQFSNGGAAFYAGKGLSNAQQWAAVQGVVSASYHIHTLAERYGVSVILHTDHAARKLLGWIDGMLLASQRHYETFGCPMVSSHMLDLSEEPIEDNIGTCVQYFQKMQEIDIALEMELGVTGGEEDGVDNTQISNARLYTQPEEVAQAYGRLSKIGTNFTIAAAFGNVHGVYKPGNVTLKPIILENSQKHVAQQFNTESHPINFVFHGGSGSKREEIQEAISYGAIKMNIDTDLQWAFWDGVRQYEAQKREYLQAQIGNPTGADVPNKKYYDPRVWLRHGELSFVERLKQAFEDLNCVKRNT